MNYNDPEATEIKSAFLAGMLAAEPTRPDEDKEGIPYCLRPANALLQSLEDLLPAPLMVRQLAKLHDKDSFISYVRAFREPGTVVFFNEPALTFTAIIDHHLFRQPMKTTGEPGEIETATPAEARWCRHRAVYKLEETPEWQAWRGHNGLRMSQTDFAHFIDAHIDDLGAADSESIQAVALNLELKQDVQFQAAELLHGEGKIKLCYTEEITGTTRDGTMKIPTGFQLFLRPYRGGPQQIAKCRFRYQLVNKAAVLWYEITNSDKLLERTIDSIRQDITDQTGVPLLAGEAS